ncbi:STAS domain-containing protein [Pseudonocardia alaniniphila]|uniref:Anti-sigma factor antagonist n=1 Tax=Pseudonocardia alaniniphila TaxID=75291 RepID=A0ABS9T816_9PSEU|nr:STAS domain-containing protein [Pseudonocardia alaniniphila]MCH6164650.1 STAS domain-containing protein [Pseudonocardia alaniniphila]
MTELGNRPPTTRCACAPPLHVDLVSTGTDTGLRVDVRLDGELDLATVDLVTDALACLRDERPELVVIDLSALRFVDAHGLRVVDSIHRELCGAGGRLVLAMPSPRVARVLAVAELDPQISVWSRGG